jgi:hypothetical protein
MTDAKRAQIRQAQSRQTSHRDTPITLPPLPAAIAIQAAADRRAAIAQAAGWTAPAPAGKKGGTP